MRAVSGCGWGTRFTKAEMQGGIGTTDGGGEEKKKFTIVGKDVSH